MASRATALKRSSHPCSAAEPSQPAQGTPCVRSCKGTRPVYDASSRSPGGLSLTRADRVAERHQVSVESNSTRPSPRPRTWPPPPMALPPYGVTKTGAVVNPINALRDIIKDCGASRYVRSHARPPPTAALARVRAIAMPAEAQHRPSVVQGSRWGRGMPDRSNRSPRTP